MDIRKGSLMLVSCFALAAGIGCAPATPPPNPVSAKVQSGLVFHSKASVATQKKHGITRWHSIIEKSTGAIVTDGQDAHGKVKFITSSRLNKKDGHLHIEAFAPIKGHLIIDTKTMGIISNTLPGTGAWAEMADAMGRDWKRLGQPVAYGFWTNAALVGGIVVAGIGLVAAAPAIAAAAGAIGLITTAAEVGAGVALAVEALAPAAAALVTAAVGAATAVASKLAADETDADVAKLTERVDALEKANTEAKPAEDPAKADPAADPSSQSPSQDPAQNPSQDPAQDPSSQTPAQEPGGQDTQTPSQDQSQDTQTPAQDTAPSEPAQGQELPADNKGGDLDTQSPDTSTGGDTSSNNDTSSNDTSSNDTGSSDTGGGGDTGGGDTGGGDTGGGGESFAVGRCRQVAISKVSKIRACTHY